MAEGRRSRGAVAEAPGVRVQSSAAGTLTGYLFQFERALRLLAQAQTYETEIGIEILDDVAVREDAAVLLLEQDKHTISGKPISDRSYALWRTLGIWSESDHKDAALCLVTNAPLSGELVTALAMNTHSDEDVSRRVALLRSAADPQAGAGTKRIATPAKLRAEIDRVMKLRDDDLAHLLSRVSILNDPTESGITRAQLAAQLGVPSDYDHEFVITYLLGWLVVDALNTWRQRKEAWFSRAQCLKACDAAMRRAARRRILPRPSREVEVTADDRESALSRTFVEHLATIDASAEDVEQAIDHFVQFGIEKHRLVDEGDVPPSEWDERGDRLVTRWRNIRRQTTREMPRSPRRSVGVRILERTTYDYRERICGEECDELYMTSGHYHRLADVNRVWWTPDGFDNAD